MTAHYEETFDAGDDQHREEAGLMAAIAAEVNTAPWYLSSTAFHALILLILMCFPNYVRHDENEGSEIHVDYKVIEKDEEIPPEPVDPPDEPDEILKTLEEEMEKVKEISQVEISEPITFEDDLVDPLEPDEMSEGDPENFDDALEELADNPLVLALNSNIPSVKRGSGPFGNRGTGNGRGKGKYVSDIGGPDGTPGAVTDALRWLAEHQEYDGYWDCNQYGGKKHDTAVTGLAVLAFLADGNSPDARSRYRDNLQRALTWLMANQDASGRIGPHRYEAAFPTMALAEAYGMCTRNGPWKRRLHEAAQNAIDYTVKTQCPAGGWDYAPNSQRNDTSVTGWYVMALKSAVTAGLDVPSEAIERARAYIVKATNDEGACSYAGKYAGLDDVKAGGGSIRMSAVSLTCQIFLGRGLKEPKVLAAAKRAIGSPPQAEQFDFYLTYYQGLGLYHYGKKNALWQQFVAGLEAGVVDTQVQQGSYRDLRGSWNPETDKYGPKWGRVGQTALGSLMCTLWRYESKGTIGS